MLVDFGSTDGLREWVAKNFEPDIRSGYLKYFYTDRMPSWHCPTAKNTSHVWARGEILVNLDCDNFTGPNGGKFLIQQFVDSSDDIVIQQLSDKDEGSYGRISMRREFFNLIGGYDQSLEAMGYQDVDLMERLKAIGLRYVHIPDPRYNRTVPNTHEDGCANILGEKVNWWQMDYNNFIASKRNIDEGRLVANKGQTCGIQQGIFDIYGKEQLFA